MLNSLKSRILFYFILFITIPLILSTSYIFYKMHESQKISIYNKHLQILKRVEQESNDIVIKVEETAKYIKENFNDSRPTLIDDITVISNYVSTILILDNNGQLKKYKSKKEIKNVFSNDFSKELFFSNLKDNINEFWSDIFLSEISSLPSISYSYRIDDQNILVLIINLDIVNNFAKRFKSINGESAVRIMNKDGFFLANPDHPSFVLENKNIKNSPFYKKHIIHDHTKQQIEFTDLEKNTSIGVYAVSEKLKWYILVKESYDLLFETFYHVLWTIVFFITLIIIISIYISIKLSKSILKPLNLLNMNMANVANDRELYHFERSEYAELDNLSDNFYIMQKKIKEKEQKILQEVKRNREKDIKLFEQSKMVALGEMIGNIAHQWRQPLSVISTIVTGILMQRKADIFDINQLEGSCNIINTQTQYLSQTINDFRNFIKGERKLESFSLDEFIKSFIHLVSPHIKSNELNIITNIEKDIIFTGYKNELLQCTINIFNNAKDALENKENKLIFIDIKQKDKEVFISIKDNAGGIPDSIINNVFEPYFTTKHKNEGTGLGLNMTYNLIVKGMKGDIIVSNEEFEYKNKKYTGANFIIILPIKYEE